jgi:rhodanese-related sulfurtransferase
MQNSKATLINLIEPISKEPLRASTVSAGLEFIIVPLDIPFMRPSVKKSFTFAILVAVGIFVIQPLFAWPGISPKEAAAKVQSGTAVLIDVREPSEWQGGVVEGAKLLSLSDLQGPRLQWTEFLKTAGDKELLIYCKSGGRSAIAAGILKKEGFRASNAGGFSSWARAGQPIVQP